MHHCWETKLCMEKTMLMEDPDVEYTREKYVVTQPEIERYLDMRGRVNSWSLRKRESRDVILGYLASAFEEGRFYTEKEVNQLLERYIVFNDPATVRRVLYDYAYLKRTKDGSRYWREAR
jgi:hypothetical protein